MKKRITIILTLLSLSAVSADAQNLLKKIDNYIAAHAMKGYDSTYVTMPKQKFMLSASYSVSRSFYETEIPYSLNEEEWKPMLESLGIDRSVSDYARYDMALNATERKGRIGISYYNIGLSYTFPLENHNTTQLTFNCNGSKYGISINYRYSEALNGTVCNGLTTLLNQMSGMDYETAREAATSDIEAGYNTLSTLLISLYYQFNGRRFSLASALNAKYLQKHSAGGFYIKGNFLRNNFTCDNNGKNTMILGDREWYKTYQFCLGAGYGYNWTPNQGKFLLHFAAAPMLSLYNRASHRTKWYINREDGTEYKESDFTDYFHNIRNSPRMSLAVQGRLAANYNFGNCVMGLILNGQYIHYHTKGGYKLDTPYFDGSLFFGIRL